MTVTPPSGPERLEHIDALRGFALAAVLLVNLRDLSLYGFLSDKARAALPTAHWDYIFGSILAAVIEHKAITIFTLLFGISFALQLRRVAVGSGFPIFYIRRLLVLLIIGVVHGIFWFGDVLRYYAVMGFFLLPARRLRPLTMVVIGLVIALFPWTLFYQLNDFFNRNALPSDQIAASALTTFGGSSLSEMVTGNVSYDWSIRLTKWSFPLAVLGRLFIGAAIGRSDALVEPKEHIRVWLWILMVTMPIGVGLTLFASLNADRTVPLALGPVIRGAASLSLGLAYIAIFILLFHLPLWRRWMSPLIAVGRMALTNYLLQTFVAIILFYGVGFGIGPRFGLIGTLPFFVAIFVIQIALSRWWLARFYFGPVEWMWRCLSYGSLIPMRKNLQTI
ncbi:MAG TPA: DUF418 domain-containing protein [Chthoniobacterales bacterium]|nr:DUF418 domain-containing protein [Chthoniobacterales bacterium]